jgi:hypothetical protein
MNISDKDVSTDLDDDDLKRRFLVGDVTPEEQAMVEARFMADAEYFEELRALEHELMLAHRRGELPEEWRARFKERVLDVPARHQRVEELDAFASALAEARSHVARGPAWRRFGVLAACVVLAVAAVLGASRFLGRGDNRGTQGPTATQPPVEGQGVVATLVLLPGLTRAALAQANIFRIAPRTQEVVFDLTVAGETNPRVSAVLRPVGGQPLRVPSEPAAVATADGLRVTWRVPAQLLQPGDYLVLLSRQSAGGPQESVASRFFTIE